MEKSKPVIGARPLFATSMVKVTSSPVAACSGATENLKDSSDVCVAVCVPNKGAIIAGEVVAEGSSVAVGARVSDCVAAGVISLVAVSEGIGVGTSIFVEVTLGVGAWKVVREDREDADILNADLLIPVELAATEDGESTCSLLISDLAAAALGSSAFSKTVVIKSTRIASSVLDLSANIFTPNFGLQPGKFS